MPRIETAQDKNIDDIEKKLEQIESRVKHSNRRFFSCFNCLIYFLILLLISGFFLAKAVAQTGFISLPYFTSHYYTAPQPSHVVAAPKDSQQESLADQIKAQVAAAAPQPGKPIDVTVRVTEQQMTQALFQYMNRNAQTYDVAQVAVIDEHLEVFLHKKDSNSPITLEVKPDFTDQGITLKITGAKVGVLPLPTGLLNWIVKTFFSNSLNQLNSWLNGYSHIKGIRWEESSVLVDLQVLIQGNLFNAL